MSRLAAALLAAVVGYALLPGTAEAAELELWRLGSPRDHLGDGKPNPRYSPDAQARFESLATHLGLALAATTGDSARTPGASGFAVDLQWSDVSVPGDRVIGDAGVWPVEGDAPTSLSVPAIHVRKGLPYSFEVGMRLSQVRDSDLLAATLEIRAALVEGLAEAPDLSLRAHAGRVLGLRDIGIVVGGFDFTVSKTFPLFRTVRIAPYAGWDPTLLFASSGAIDFDPTQESFDNPALDDAVFESYSSLFHRFYGGLGLNWGPARFALEYSYASAGPDSVGAFSAITGVDF